MIVSKGKTILVADTNVTELPSAERLINISKSCVRIARLFGFEPKSLYLTQLLENLYLKYKTCEGCNRKIEKKKVDFDFDGGNQM